MLLVPSCVQLIALIVLRTTKVFIHILYGPFMWQSKPIQTGRSQVIQRPEARANAGKKPKYVKLTMSSKRFSMLARHVLRPASCRLPLPTCPSAACDYMANLFKAFNKHAQPHTKWRTQTHEQGPKRGRAAVGLRVQMGVPRTKDKPKTLN